MSSGGFIKSLGYAWEGFRYAVMTQGHMRIHVLVALIVVVVSWILDLSRMEWALIVIAILLVWAAEIINTGLEEIVDLVSPGYDEKAGRAKNLGAAAALVMAFNSVLIGIFVFGPRLLHWMGR